MGKAPLPGGGEARRRRGGSGGGAGAEDTDALAALRLQLRRILESDPALAAELAGLLEAAGPRITYQGQVQGSGALVRGNGNVVAGAGGIAAGRDVVGK